MSTRKQQIERALARLRVFQKDPAYTDKQYAVQANITFLEAARSLLRYLWWLFKVAPKLDGSRLLELTDFPVEEWDVAMHERLIEMQKRKRPGLVTPLVNAITEYTKKESRDLIIANLGAGGMEVDRQVAEWALKENSQHTLTIVGVDKSSITRRIADRNLKGLADRVEMVETGELTATKLGEIQKETTKKVLIVMCTNDIFGLDKKFGKDYFDLVYHSLFRHHLTPTQQIDLDRTVGAISKKHFEFDGYKSWPHGLIQSLFAWTSPVFLNGTIISMARYRAKDEISREGGDISYYDITSHYLRRLQS